MAESGLYLGIFGSKAQAFKSHIIWLTLKNKQIGRQVERKADRWKIKKQIWSHKFGKFKLYKEMEQLGFSKPLKC